MNVGMISKRYAKALLQYAMENKAEDKVYSEMKQLEAAFAAEPRMRMAMDNPTLTAKDKLDLMKAAVGGNAREMTTTEQELLLPRPLHYLLVTNVTKHMLRLQL